MSDPTQDYGIRRRLDLPYADAIEATRAALATEGFGILTEIDVRATLKKKLDADFRDYIILGACNPGLAHRALQSELEVGLLLPCNVIVYDSGDGGSMVSVIEPLTMLGVAPNSALGPVAEEARERLVRALAAIG
jgi:uncharacterized protein (DUF302 family)